MVKYLFTSILGNHVFDNNFNLVFTASSPAMKKDIIPLPEKHLSRVLAHFRDKKYFKDFYEKNLELTSRSLRESATGDVLIIQAINSLEEAKKAVNMLAKKAREWYAWYCPELLEAVHDDEKMVEILISANKEQILKKLGRKESIGSPLTKSDIEPVILLAKEIRSLYSLAASQKAYLDKLMSQYCPNIAALAGSLIGAKLVEQSSSLKRLSEFPSSTIQLLGAEKSLFRHLKTGSRPPKYGFLHEHPLISSSRKQLHGRIARVLADKIAIAAKVDYFKGKFIGDKLRKDVEKRFIK